jgi:hypothetical protein
MPSRQRSQTVVAIALITATACQSSDQPTLNTAQMMMETEYAIDGIRSELAILQAEIDSLRVDLVMQDSLIRVMFNLQGNPLPPKPVVPPE